MIKTLKSNLSYKFRTRQACFYAITVYQRVELKIMCKFSIKNLITILTQGIIQVFGLTKMSPFS